MSAVDETSTAAVAASAQPDAYARKALIASAVGYAMDGFDLLILGFIMSAIAAELHLSPAAGGLARRRGRWWARWSAACCSACFSDYVGRVRVLTWTILLFAVFTGFCALAQGYWDLLTYPHHRRPRPRRRVRHRHGARVAEAWPASQRARVSLLCRPRLAGGRAGGGAGDADPAAAHRLARHVRGRRAAGGGVVPRAPRGRRARALQRAETARRAAASLWRCW